MRLFLSYAQPDQDLRDRLIQHLSLLKRERILDTWDISEITAGTEREPAIAQQIDQAEIILLLISAAFIASDRYDVEMKRAIERHKNRQARVIPILLKPCDWESAPFAELEVLPKGGKPVTAGDIETALSTIAQEIRRVAVELNPALAKPRKSVMKRGAPLPGVRLPENFVERPEALNAVKALLLEESEKPLVVSAIAGLGGLGKSVLATALVLDPEVQERFEDGILWVTLGQKPDLQSLLGDWIRTLDKSREGYSATTLEAASRYLQTLLIEKRMLLVVDDVWIGAHVEHFRVGGAACRMLVTTREAQIEGAEVHALDLMSEEEAIALVRQKLNRQWNPAQESEVKAFAKSLGYLPLALDLAANQVRDGLSWGELRSEFETERRAVALEVLDSSEAWETLDEKEQRKYSLRACFNLSLRRLSAEQLWQFAWLGVLPEDVSLDVRMAMTLWELPRVQAKKVLVLLKNRSFLTSGTETLEGEPTFRVHDLMHDTARGLLEQDALSDPLRSLQAPIQNPKSKIQNLASAHAQLLERYRLQAEGRWDRLPNDGYIHRHLTWHFVQAEIEDEIHALMAMSDERGRNAWFEACDRIGQPAIFVQDVKRGWEVAEQSYEKKETKSIVLQCRYALITATLNTLVKNLPIDMIIEFVKRGFWTLEHAWSYVEQMHNDQKAIAIVRLAPYLSKSIVKLALDTAREIPDRENYARVLRILAQMNTADFDQIFNAAQGIQDAEMLRALAKAESADFNLLLDAAQKLNYEEAQDELSHRNSLAYDLMMLGVSSPSTHSFKQASVLCDLAQMKSAKFEEVINIVRKIQSQFRQASVLRDLARINPTCFSEALDAVRKIHPDFRAPILRDLARINPTCFSEALDAARKIQDSLRRASVLCDLAQINPTCFSEALDTTQSIKDEYGRASILRTLAQIDSTKFDELFNVVQSIQNESSRTSCFCTLAQMDSVQFDQLLNAAQSIQDESSRAEALRALAQMDSAQFDQLFSAVQSIQDESSRAEALRALAQMDSAQFDQLFSAVQSIQDESSRAEALRALAQMDSAQFDQLFSAVQSIQDESSRAEALRALAQMDSAQFDQLFSAVQLIQNRDRRTSVLSTLVNTKNANFAQLLALVRSIRDEYAYSKSLIRAMSYYSDLSYIDVAGAFKTIFQGYEPYSAFFFSDLAYANLISTTEAVDLIQAVRSQLDCALALGELAGRDYQVIPLALQAACSVQDETDRNLAIKGLIGNLPLQVLPKLLELVDSLEISHVREKILSRIAQRQAPENAMTKSSLDKKFKIIEMLPNTGNQAQELHSLLPHLPLTILPLNRWISYLHLLAHRNRADLMQDLATLYPTIVHLGGKEAVRGMVDAMREVCQQWK